MKNLFIANIKILDGLFQPKETNGVKFEPRIQVIIDGESHKLPPGCDGIGSRRSHSMEGIQTKIDE